MVDRSLNSYNGISGDGMAMDLASFSQVCENIRQIMQDVVELKSNSTKTDDQRMEITELRMQGSFHFLSLKQLNRSAQIQCKQAKDRTLEAKQKLDGYNLQLENLQYEISHLHKEITKCLEFRSRHEQVPLVSVATFYKDAPTHISNPAETRSDKHKQTLARLDYELEQRKRLADELGQRGRAKEEMCGKNGVKKQHLQALAPGLQSLLRSSLPLQEALGVPLSRMRNQQELARLLPRPLFVLFIQFRAYQEACDGLVEVSIKGDEAAARARRRADGEKSAVGTEEEESDSDAEEDEGDSGRGHKRRSSTKMEVEETQAPPGLLTAHPLCVCVDVGVAKAGATLQLTFYHVTALGIVTVQSRFQPSGKFNEKLLGSPFLEESGILRSLFPGDDGASCPSPSASLLLSRSPYRMPDLASALGRPYQWTQKLCGLEFLPADDQVDASLRVQSTVKAIRRRVNSRVSLAAQLDSLGGNVVPSVARADLPAKIVTKLKSWRQMTYSEYSGLPYVGPIVELGLLDGGVEHLYFLATMSRDDIVTLQCGIAISVDYPRTPPLISLQVDWEGERNGQNDLNIREMECDVNFNDGRGNNDIISIQLLRLMALLDVYVETDASSDLPRVSKGPARLKPFVFGPNTQVRRHKGLQ